MNIDERELHRTMEEFMEEDSRNKNIWNFATISGLVILFLVSSYLMQLIIGPNWGPDLSGIVQILPVVGGVILIIVGFGFLASNKRKNKDDMLQNDIENRARQKAESDYGYSSRETGSQQEKSDSEEHEQEGRHQGKKAGSESFSGGASTTHIDSYGLKKTKKLYKSRSDKKLCGVCGGLADYFGISSTIVRLIFVVLTLVGWGSAAILYVALCIALKKEPVEFMDEFASSPK